MSTRNLSVGYRLTRNATSTAEKAPYLGIAVPVGSLAYDNILAKMLDAGTFMSAATAQYFLNAFYEFAAEEIAANAVRVNTGAVAIYPMIGGSFDSEDDTFKAPRNTLYVGATLSQEIRDAVAGIVPDYLGDETAAGAVKINSVFDLATMTNGVIDGTKDFRICGIDLTVPDDADESLTFVKKDGVTKVADIAVSETADGQRLTCHLTGIAAAIPKGTYKVHLASHGLDPTAPLSVVTKTVTLVSDIAPAPTITKIATSGKDGIVKGEAFDIEGTNLAYGEGDSVKAKWNVGGTAGEQLLAPTAVTATKMSFAAVSGFEALPDNTELTFEVTVGGTTVTKATTLLAKPLNHVVIDSLRPTRSGGRTCVNIAGQNFTAVQGYAESGEQKSFPADVYVNGEMKGSITGTGPNYGEFVELYADDAQVGDMVKVVLHINPAKTDFDQTPVEAMAAVVEA